MFFVVKQLLWIEIRTCFVSRDPPPLCLSEKLRLAKLSRWNWLYGSSTGLRSLRDNKPRSMNTRHTYCVRAGVSWGVVAERSSLPDSSSGVSSRMWVRIPVVTLVSLSKTLNHNCFVLRMGRKAVGPVCCVMHVKEPRDTYRKREGACPGVSGMAAKCAEIICASE